MKKYKPLIIGIVAVVLSVIIVVTAMYFKNSNQANKENESNNQSTATSVNPPPSTSGEVSTAGTYIDYSQDAIKNTKGTKVLFFHAPWCPQCMMLDKSIKSGKIPDGVTILKVDYDSNQALRKQYGVTLQTTLVQVDDDGKLIKKYTAYNEPTLQALIDNVL